MATLGPCPSASFEGYGHRRQVGKPFPKGSLPPAFTSLASFLLLAHAEIREAALAECRGRIKVTPVKKDGGDEGFLYAIKIGIAELVPLGGYEQGVGTFADGVLIVLDETRGLSANSLRALEPAMGS